MYLSPDGSCFETHTLWWKTGYTHFNEQGSCVKVHEIQLLFLLYWRINTLWLNHLNAKFSWNGDTCISANAFSAELLIRLWLFGNQPVQNWSFVLTFPTRLYSSLSGQRLAREASLIYPLHAEVVQSCNRGRHDKHAHCPHSQYLQWTYHKGSHDLLTSATKKGAM